MTKKTAQNPLRITYRELETKEDYAACIVLQKLTWGEHFQECVPPAILLVTQKISGILAGAFDEKGEMIGFVYGMTGIKDDEPVNWSHMLAVRPEFRGQGIGEQLKRYQRDLLLERNVHIVYWTYDPLVARNAHLNLNKLGAEITEYVPDIYMDDSGSVLDHGIGMDRFIVRWSLRDQRVEDILSVRRVTEGLSREELPLVNADAQEGSPILTTEFPDVSAVRIEVPEDIEELQSQSLDLAAQWRQSSKAAFLWYQARSYTVTAFHRDADTRRCFYAVER